MRRIRLTESQLNRVIKESVKRIIKEVRVGDEDLHGNNPQDWQKMARYRYDNQIHSIEQERDNLSRSAIRKVMRGERPTKEEWDSMNNFEGSPKHLQHQKGVRHFVRDYNNFAIPTGNKQISVDGNEFNDNDDDNVWYKAVEPHYQDYDIYGDPKEKKGWD